MLQTFLHNDIILDILKLQPTTELRKFNEINSHIHKTIQKYFPEAPLFVACKLCIKFTLTGAKISTFCSKDCCGVAKRRIEKTELNYQILKRLKKPNLRFKRVSIRLKFPFKNEDNNLKRLEEVFTILIDLKHLWRYWDLKIETDYPFSATVYKRIFEDLAKSCRGLKLPRICNLEYNEFEKNSNEWRNILNDYFHMDFNGKFCGPRTLKWEFPYYNGLLEEVVEHLKKVKNF